MKTLRQEMEKQNMKKMANQVAAINLPKGNWKPKTGCMCRLYVEFLDKPAVDQLW